MHIDTQQCGEGLGIGVGMGRCNLEGVNGGKGISVILSAIKKLKISIYKCPSNPYDWSL